MADSVGEEPLESECSNCKEGRKGTNYSVSCGEREIPKGGACNNYEVNSFLRSRNVTLEMKKEGNVIIGDVEGIKSNYHIDFNLSETTFKGAPNDLICGGSLLAHLQVES